MLGSENVKGFDIARNYGSAMTAEIVVMRLTDILMAFP